MRASDSSKPIDRNPEATRARIIQAAFQEIHRHGYQGMRLDDVMAVAGITKGGLYHHFDSKKALVSAVIETVIRSHIEEFWLQPLQAAEQPRQALIDIIRTQTEDISDDILTLGCPLNNLAQEMSPLDEDFRRQINRIYQLWKESVVQALERGKSCGAVRQTLDTRETAIFILAAVEGCIGMAKNAQSRDVLAHCTAGLINYLDSLA